MHSTPRNLGSFLNSLKRLCFWFKSYGFDLYCGGHLGNMKIRCLPPPENLGSFLNILKRLGFWFKSYGFDLYCGGHPGNMKIRCLPPPENLGSFLNRVCWAFLPIFCGFKIFLDMLGFPYHPEYIFICIIYFFKSFIQFMYVEGRYHNNCRTDIDLFRNKRPKSRDLPQTCPKKNLNRFPDSKWGVSVFHEWACRHYEWWSPGQDWRLFLEIKTCVK